MALNFASVITNSGMSAALKTRIIEAVISVNGYTETVKDESGNDIPNPVSKVAFYNNVITEYNRNCVMTKEATAAANAAREAKILEINSLGIQ